MIIDNDSLDNVSLSYEKLQVFLNKYFVFVDLTI